MDAPRETIAEQHILEPAVQEHLRLSTFEGKFDVRDFVGAISEGLIADSKAHAGPFDPKPFIRTFEAAVGKLINVRKDVQAKTEHMEKSVRVSEREYSKKMAELNRGFEAVGNSFGGMESKMSEVGRTAIRMGEQLESIHLERQRAQAALDLIDAFNNFSQDDTSLMDAMKKGREGRRQVATLLRRLNAVAKEVDLPNADQVRENIDRYCEKFEKEMLALFDKSYRKGDPKMMHHCAQTLLDFNGGSSCVQVYVNQHDFFINRIDHSVNAADSEIWTVVHDPDSSPPKSEPVLSELFSEIRATVAQESEIVRVVFPNPPFVMQVFLQRVFAQSIQQQMEQLLNKGAAGSDLGFLRMLQIVHIQASTLVEDLKTHELPVVVPRSPLDNTEFRRSLSSSSSSTPSQGTTAVSVMLESAMEELFVPYTEGQRYLERESKCLANLYARRLTPFARYHAQTHDEGKSTMFGRMMNQLSSAGNVSSTGPSTTGATAAAALMRLGGIGAASGSQPQTQDKPGEDPIREEDGQLSVDVAEKMLKWHAEAIGRCVELSSPGEVPKNTFALMRVLSETLGSGYVGIALETTLARLDASDSRVPPNLNSLTVMRFVDLICHLWQQYVNVALFPLASSSVTVRREMAVFNNQTISRIEGLANQVMQKTTDMIISWLSAQLAKQKKMDFKPKDEDLSFARVNTEPCAACCEMLERVRDAANLNLSGKNLEVFLTEIGLAFHGLLLEHMRKFPVSATGGLMLAKDIRSYQDTVATFSIPALKERFEFLRQLGQIFLVRPDVLKSYITEDYLGRIDSELLKPYLAQRSDWGQSERAFNDGLPSASAEAAAAESKGFGSRFARLSTMMRDFDLGEGMGMSGLSNMPSIPAGLPSRFSLSGRP